MLDESPHGNLREIIKTVGGQAAGDADLRLVRWIADYYCCAPEIAMKAVLPDAVRKEEEGWRERLYVRALPQHGEPPKLTKRQEDLWTIVEVARVAAAGTGALGWDDLGDHLASSRSSRTRDW